MLFCKIRTDVSLFIKNKSIKITLFKEHNVITVFKVSYRSLI